MSRKATGPGSIRGLLCRSGNDAVRTIRFLAEAVVQADGDRLNVGSMGDGAERAWKSHATCKGRSAGSDVTSQSKNQIFRSEAPMHVDAVFETAAGRPARQILGGRRIQRHGGDAWGGGKDHASGVPRRDAAALQVEHRVASHCADT